MRLNYFIKKIVNSGVTSETKLSDAKKIRVLNIGCLITFIIFPILFIINLSFGNDKEFYPMAFILLMHVIVFIFNKNNKNQLASVLIVLSGIITSSWATILNDFYIAAPYFNIIMGLFAMFLFTKKVLKIAFSSLAFTTFFILNWYQIKYKIFETGDYSIVLLFLIGLLLLTYLYNKESIRNELLIKKQANNLRLLQKKQLEKDIETMAANNRMQLQIRENILNKLKNTTNEDDILKSLKSIIVELKNQIESQKKIHFLELNIDRLNNTFFEKLNKNHPNLSKREKEICSYIKLGLSTKEIASLTNSTVNTIYVTKNRMKKKLSLSSNSEIDSYFKTF